MNLGENIYRLRTGKNMSQGDLADALDVSRQSVSKWENNSAVPELEKLIKMSELFGVTLDDMVGIAPTPAAPAEPSQHKVLSLRQILGIILFAFTLILLLVVILVPGIDSGSGLALVCAFILLTTSLLAYDSSPACILCVGLWIFSFFMWLHGSDSRFNLWFFLFSTPVSVIWGSLRLRNLWK